MSDEHWNQDFAKSLAIYLNGHALRTVNPKGEKIIDNSFYLIFNAFHESLTFVLPPEKYGRQWIKVLDTGAGIINEDEGEKYAAGDNVKVENRSVVVLKQLPA